MNILLRALQNKKKTLTDRINFLDRNLATKDLYLNDIVLINFELGQELYFYIVKNLDKSRNGCVLNALDVQGMIFDNAKVLSIELKSLKDNQFKREQKEIKDFIKQAGGH